MKTIYLLLLFGCFIYNTLLFNVVLNENWFFITIAVGGSFSGSMIFAYTRREASKREQLLKILGSTITGLVFGAMLVEWREITKTPYILGSFFFSGMLSLIFVRSIIKFTETNSDNVTVIGFQTIINKFFPVKRPRTKQLTKKVEDNEQ